MVVRAFIARIVQRRRDARWIMQVEANRARHVLPSCQNTIDDMTRGI